jgi:hypothetical protein
MMMPSMITETVDDVEQTEEMSRVHESVDSNPVRLAVTGVRNADPAVQSYVIAHTDKPGRTRASTHSFDGTSLFVIVEHKMDYHSLLSSSLFSSSYREDAFSSSSTSFRCALACVFPCVKLCVH